MRVRLVLSARPDSRIQPPHRAGGDCVGAILLDWLGHYESAATVAGFAFSPLTAASFPKIKLANAHLRNILGEQTYEALARKGRDDDRFNGVLRLRPIDQARAELSAVSK